MSRPLQKPGAGDADARSCLIATATPRELPPIARARRAYAPGATAPAEWDFRWSSRAKAVREKALRRLWYETAARASKALSLNIEHFDLANHSADLRSGSATFSSARWVSAEWRSWKGVRRVLFSVGGLRANELHSANWPGLLTAFDVQTWRPCANARESAAEAGWQPQRWRFGGAVDVA
jgi:hypothetical protein